MNPMLLAALIGGGTSVATGYMSGNRGDDLWKDALIGAVMGGATSGLGSLFQGSQAATAAGKTAAMTPLEIAEAAMKNPTTTQSMVGHMPTSITKNVTTKAMEDAAKKKAAADALKQPWKHTQYPKLGQALDPFGASAGDLGKYAYLTTPTAAMMGQMAFGSKPKLDPKKQFVPPFNVHYGRDPGAYGFGDWFDEDAIKERYEEGSMDYPYYYPEMAQGGEVRGGYQEGGLPAALGAGLGGSQEGTTDAIQSLLAEYYNQEEQVFDDETIQALIEQVLSQQTSQYQPMSGIAGQLQGMTQQYTNPQPQQSQQPGGYNYGGDVRRHYQEGAFGEDMLASGDLDMRPGGESVGPGTGTSDDIPAMLSDGEFVMTSEAVEGAGGGDREMGAQRMMNMMKNFEGGGLPSLQSQGLGAPEEMMAEESVTEMGPQGMMSESMMEEEII